MSSLSCLLQILTCLAFTSALSAQVTSGPCTRRTSIVLSEIHYHPPGEALENGEFIELYNSSPISVDLSGWKLRGDADFDFPEGTRLGGGEFLVIASDPSVLAKQGITALGPWTGNLSNGGGRVRLRKASGGIVLETNYDDNSRWPLAADGSGHSLVLQYPSYGESRTNAWSASYQPGGSPGGFDPISDLPLDQIVISEILAHNKEDQEDFVEFHNSTESPIDLSRCFLTRNDSLAGYQIPEGTILSPGQYLAFNGNVAGFNFDSTGDKIFLQAPDGKRVIVSRKFTGQAEGRSWGGLEHWRERQDPSPNRANSPEFRDQIVINEIHYHPSNGENKGEFLELFNSGTSSIDLSNWRIKGGIAFTFPEGTSIEAGDFLVIAKDKASLLSIHADLGADAVVGDYSGSLSNNSERIELEDTGNRTVDEVTYHDGGRWPQPADGGGTSMQFLDASADNSLGHNWSAADESEAANTVIIEHTGILDFGHRATPRATRFFIMLHGRGEAIIDDVEVLHNGNNLVSNGNFESSLSGWKSFGTHSQTFAENGAMHLVASDEGDLANLVETTLPASIAPGSTVTLRARCRWVSGDPDLLLGLNGGFLEAGGTLPVPEDVGTPGAANTDLQNVGPAVTEVSHFPLLPTPGDPITIRARITDSDGVGSVRLRYRIDPASSLSQIVMTDSGDGFYEAIIPAQANGSLVAFHFITIDAGSPGVVSRYPENAPDRECLVRVGSENEAGDFSTMHLWVTNANLQEWRNRERSSNTEIDATFVSEGRAFYNIGTYYAGSQNGVTIYNSPTGNPTGYNLKLPDDEVFLNVQNLTIDRETTRDSTRQRERLLFWFLEKLKLPNLHRRYVHFYFNGVERDQLIMEDVQKPNRDIMDEWFEGKGRLTKTNPWFEFDANGNILLEAGAQRNALSHRRTSNGRIKIPPHRWTWTHGSGHDDGNDFSGIIDLINAAESPDETLVENLRQKAELRQWMRTFAMNDLGSFWDTFGNQAAKNAYLYESFETGKWSVVVWDMDVGLGVAGDPVRYPLFHPNTDPAMQRIYAQPDIVRDYWQALDESLDTFFTASAGSEIHEILQETYNALLANDAPVTSPFVPSGMEGLAVDDWITQRRAFIQSQLAGKDGLFSVNGPATSTTQFVTLKGTTALASERLLANDISLDPEYSSLTEWSADVPLQPGMNDILVESFDQDGNSLGSEIVKINYLGSDLWAELKINEWMAANPASTGIVDPVDQNAEDWIELYNPGNQAVSLAGWHLSDDPTEPMKFTIPGGFTIPAQGYLLIWADDEALQNDPSQRSDLHVSFKLSAAGEGIILTAPDGSTIDEVTFAEQTSGLARVRLPDGGENLSYTASPTPVTTNGVIQTYHPVIIDASFNDQQTYLSFETETGRIYEMERSSDLLNWSSTAHPVLSDGTPLTFSIPFEAEQLFLRIRTH